MLETDLIDLEDLVMSEKSKSKLVVTCLMSNLYDMGIKSEQKINKKQNITKSNRKLERGMKELIS